jgi:hypothetical protein
LSVVGGDIAIVGNASVSPGRFFVTLFAPGGRMQLASVASLGVVPLELAPDLQVEGFARLGRIALSEAAKVAVSSPTGVAVSSRPGAGTVLIRGGRLLVDNALIQANTTGARRALGSGSTCAWRRISSSEMGED